MEHVKPNIVNKRRRRRINRGRVGPMGMWREPAEHVGTDDCHHEHNQPRHRTRHRSDSINSFVSGPGRTPRPTAEQPQHELRDDRARTCPGGACDNLGFNGAPSGHGVTGGVPACPVNTTGIVTAASASSTAVFTACSTTSTGIPAANASAIAALMIRSNHT